jgi:hypothetical protein
MISRLARRHRQGRRMLPQVMPAVIPIILLPQRLPTDPHTRPIRLYLLLQHLGLSQRIHTRLTSNPLAGKPTLNRRILTQPSHSRIHTGDQPHLPRARMPPQVQLLLQATTLRPMVANTLSHNNHSLREILSPEPQNDTSMGWCYLISCTLVESVTAWHCSTFPRHSVARRYPSSGFRNLFLESGHFTALMDHFHPKWIT